MLACEATAFLSSPVWLAYLPNSSSPTRRLNRRVRLQSKDLALLHFSGWAAFNRACKGPVIDDLPELPGVYAVRGASELIYFRVAVNEEGIARDSAITSIPVRGVDRAVSVLAESETFAAAPEAAATLGPPVAGSKHTGAARIPAGSLECGTVCGLRGFSPSDSWAGLDPVRS